jgi:hypothetical protein
MAVRHDLPSLGIVAVVCDLFVILIAFCERSYANKKPRDAEPVPPMLMPQELGQQGAIGAAFATDGAHGNHSRPSAQL